MRVLIKATYEWTEEVSDEDLRDIIERSLEDADPNDDDTKDRAFEVWQEEKEDSLNEDPGNITEDAKLSVSIVVTK